MAVGCAMTRHIVTVLTAGLHPPVTKQAEGGSVDSGPAQIDHSLRDGLLIFFLLVVPILILIVIALLFMFKKEWMNKLCRRRNKPRNQSDGNGQTRATPATQPQSPPATFQTPHAYPEGSSGFPPNYEDLYQGNAQYGTSGIQNPVPRQGPAAGKSTLAQTLPSYTRKKGWRICILSYDEIIPEEAYVLRKGENDAFMDTQSSWKLYRQEVLQCLDAFLQSENAPMRATCSNRDTWARFARTLRDQLKASDDSLPQVSHVKSEPLIVLLDDNFYYPSMRYEVYQLARKYSLGFCQLYLQCPLNSCLTRNRIRSCPVPDEVIVEMAKRIEPPNPVKNPWEQNSLALTSTISFSQQDIDLLIQLLGAALENPLTPIQDNTEQKEADQLCCASSIVHQADQACRRLVSQAMKDAKECKWPTSTMKSLAADLNQLKMKFLEDLRNQALQGYPMFPGETINVELVVSRAVAVFEQDKDDVVRKHAIEPVKPL
ncbi:hypothetical protein SKAU_G00143930 [Synaphobranchus kaupii]|uniref:L-seryl-tRNA(Sec) kinase n=1 Tax=Synaphobranchus kaupii TaxID=118154 RepID=A0A9Q1FTT9_SYNKA|nr:hypothetical protein SKAU_G00143930 [Synaphobranchus kaupii]